MSLLCLAAAGVAVEVATSGFTLAWTHSIERTHWEERWRVEADRLVLEEARVQGSGAGMEPPPEARREGSFYVWQPQEERRVVVLRRDPHAGDWHLCAGGRCAPLGRWVGNDADPVRLQAGACNRG